MNVAAIAVGVGALCLASIEGPQAVPAPSFTGPVLVVAPGFTNRVAALEVMRTVDLPFTMDEGSGSRSDGRDWPKAGSYKTLVLVPGFPLDTEDAPERDLSRISGLISQAKKANASILLLHLGSARTRGSSRGSRIDDSNLLAARSAGYIVVAGDGNKDGFFTAQAAARGIPLETVGGLPDAGEAVMKLFKVRPRMSPGSVGAMLPPFSTARTPDRSTFDFASLRGRWLALHFWTAASREIARLGPYQAKYGDRVQFVGIAVDSYESQWKRTIDDLPANWRHVLNGTGHEDLAARFDVHVLPMRLLIDPSGKVVGRFAGNLGNSVIHQPNGRYEVIEPFFAKLDELFRRP